MQPKNARRVTSFGNFNPRAGSFASELPKPADWDQLLVTLRLTEAQALEAIQSDEAVGQQLQDFVLRFCRHQFVPEAVINAAFRRRKGKRRVLPSAIRGTTISPDVAAVTGDGQR